MIHGAAQPQGRKSAAPKTAKGAPAKGISPTDPRAKVSLHGSFSTAVSCVSARSGAGTPPSPSATERYSAVGGHHTSSKTYCVRQKSAKIACAAATVDSCTDCERCLPQSGSHHGHLSTTFQEKRARRRKLLCTILKVGTHRVVSSARAPPQKRGHTAPSQAPAHDPIKRSRTLIVRARTPQMDGSAQ